MCSNIPLDQAVLNTTTSPASPSSPAASFNGRRNNRRNTPSPIVIDDDDDDEEEAVAVAPAKKKQRVTAEKERTHTVFMLLSTNLDEMAVYSTREAAEAYRRDLIHTRAGPECAASPAREFSIHEFVVGADPKPVSAQSTGCP